MVQIAKAAALAAVAAAAMIVALRLRPLAPSTTVVVEHSSWLPRRVVRVTEDEIIYKGHVVARVPPCPDSPCFRIEGLLDALAASEPDVPPGAFEPARLVLVEIDASTDAPTERLVLNTIIAAGFWPVVTYIGR